MRLIVYILCKKLCTKYFELKYVFHLLIVKLKVWNSFKNSKTDKKIFRKIVPYHRPIPI